MGKLPAKLEREVRVFLHRARAIIEVDRLLVFGSFARGQAREGSDVDLILVSPDFEGLDLVERYVKVRPLWDGLRAVDILPYTPAEFSGLHDGPTIVNLALAEGIAVA